MEVKEHYEKHLADFYSWMIGDFDKAKTSFKNFCVKNAIRPFETGVAIDLGAGNGVQSIALGEIGFKVKAVDFNDKLLSELNQKINGLPIEAIKDDMKNVNSIADASVDLIACCGDTLTHLETFDQLDKLIKDCYDSLTKNGQLILTFRDYSVALAGTQRFIPVKSDDNRILTCILDYFDTKITVTDLLHEKIDGVWTQKISSYNKLRLKPDYVIKLSEDTGFSVSHNENINGMLHLILKK